MDDNHMKNLEQLIRRGTSPFHVASAVERELLKEGYEELPLNCPWELKKGGKYYVMHHDSTLIAFFVGADGKEAFDLRIAAAHTDFPGLRIKQNAELLREGYAQLNVEVYGGAILNTWMDRPLSAAGRVALRSSEVFRPRIRLVDFRRPLFVIPNLAVHLNREINKGKELNRQKEMLPIAGTAGREMSGQFFLELLAEELSVEPEEILDYEIGLYNADEPVYTGMKGELFSAPRIDNLSGVQAVLTGLLEGGRAGVVGVAAFFDHEEVGSRTKQGAGSMILETVLEKLCRGLSGERGTYLQSLSDGMLLSVDVGHAFHPNYPEKMDVTNKCPLNGGLCIKEASSQSYATDCRAVGAVQQICMCGKIPYAKYFNRSDGTSGSTLGSIASSLVPVSTVDVGIPILAMHSARELMGTGDMEALTDLLRAYYTL